VQQKCQAANQFPNLPDIIMSFNPEQFAAANKANLDALVALSQQAFKGIEQLVELNLQAARSSMEDSADKARAALGATDPQSLLALQTSLLQPNTDKAVAYGKQVADIAAATQAEVSKLAEAQIAQAQAQLSALVETAAKNAPAGSETAVAAVKTAIANATSAFDSVQKAAKQAVSVAEANLKTLSASAESNAKAAAEAVKKSTKRA
jgi:phasin family protein